MLDVKSILNKREQFSVLLNNYEDWTPVGPGARKALSSIFSIVHTKKISEQQYFRMLNVVFDQVLKHIMKCMIVL